MRTLSNTVATKEFVPNTLGKCFTFNNSLLGNIFTFIFLCLTSILNTKIKYVLFVMTAIVFFNVKRLFKTNDQNASPRIVTFLWSFYLCCKFIKYMQMPNDVKEFTVWKIFAQLCSINSFDVFSIIILDVTFRTLEETLNNASIDISFFGWPSAIFGSLSRGQPHSLNVNHFLL